MIFIGCLVRSHPPKTHNATAIMCCRTYLGFMRIGACSQFARVHRSVNSVLFVYMSKTLCTGTGHSAGVVVLAVCLKMLARTVLYHQHDRDRQIN